MNNDVVLISYPSGGFGNFIFHALTEFSDNTFKTNNFFNFSSSGSSHQTHKYTNVYFHDPNEYILPNIDTDKKVLVLCDNGITNDSYTKIRKFFPEAPIIRLCITPDIRPVVYQTCVVKAQESTLLKETSNQVNENWIDANNDYAIRENFTLMYHNWNFAWREIDNVINVNIEDLINNPVDTICSLISTIGGQVINATQLVELCSDWKYANQNYFKVYYDWQKINQALDDLNDIELKEIVDLHEQGYINYCIERKFNVTIPVYDYKDWFTNTKQIKEMLECLRSNP